MDPFSLFLGGAMAGLSMFGSASSGAAASRAAAAEWRQIKIQLADDKRRRSTQLQRDLATVQTVTAAGGQSGQSFRTVMQAIAGDAAVDTRIIDFNAQNAADSAVARAKANQQSPLLAGLIGGMQGYQFGTALKSN